MNGAIARTQAAEHFERLFRQAFMQRMLSMILRRPNHLLSFDEVRDLIHSHQQVEQGTQMIRLDSIVGSVGRYRDFTSTFLPLSGADKERWKRLDAALNSLESWPPIDVFKVGSVYFVRDGNHRVSVAHANGASHIEANVTEIQTPVEITPGMDMDDILLKAGQAEFIEKTHLNEVRPGAEIILTEPGRYPLLLEHIDVHRYYMGLERDDEVPYNKAVASWYDTVYLPIVEVIRSTGILREFPRRTEADLYLWITHHRERLKEIYGDDVSPDVAVSTFAETHTDRPVSKMLHGMRSLMHAMVGGDGALIPATEEPPIVLAAE